MTIPNIPWLSNFMLELAKNDPDAHRTVSDTIVFSWARNGNYEDTLAEVAMVMEDSLTDDVVGTFYDDAINSLDITKMMTELMKEYWTFGSGKEPYDPER